MRAKRGGRIAGAVHVQWLTTLNEDGTFSDVTPLRPCTTGPA